MTRTTPVDLPEDMPISNNLVGVTYLNPDLHRGFASLSGRVHSASHLSVRTRELVILRVAGHLAAPYQLQQHEVGARNFGLTAKDITAAREGDVAQFPADEAVALRLATAVENRTVDTDLWRQARLHYSEVELSDLVMLAGFYGLASRFTLALDLDLEPPPA
jgi:alkylhydroperoxidase family enzyme